MKNKVNVEENLKKIKNYTKYIELTEKYLKDIGEIDEIMLYGSEKLEEIKVTKDILFKQLICDHKNTYEDSWRTHNDSGIDVICTSCKFLLETK